MFQECRICGRKFVSKRFFDVCSGCYNKREEVHELYLACQSLKKRLGMPYDPVLDEEVKNIIEGE